MTSAAKATPSGHEREFALQVSDVTKVYGGEVALGGVSLTVAPGEIHGLLGANGAGKSTLVRIICGAEMADGGDITIDGQHLPKSNSAAAAKAAGLTYIHQDRALAGDMSIADNISLTAGFPRNKLGLIREGESERRARAALDRVGIDLDPKQLVNELTIAEQTMVAIARALAVDAKVVLLDEPTANLGKLESSMLYGKLRQLAKENVAMVLITHAIDEALEHCDRITVLRNGQVAGSDATSELTAPDLIGMIVGGHAPSLEMDGAGRLSDGSEVRLRANAVRTERLGPIDAEIRAGEIVGITGLADSGHLAFGELLFGQLGLEAGSLEVGGRPFTPSTPEAAMGRGIGYVPSDRVRDGLATGLSLQENLFLDRLFRSDDSRTRRARAERERATHLLNESSVKPRDPDAMIETLSGGNMQKVLIARWLAKQPDLLVLSEPTIGVDVGARAEIYSRVATEAARGVAVVVTSSDFEEIATLCDRALVLRYGRVVGELSGDALTIQGLTDLSSTS